MFWREHHADVLEEWIREEPGTRPWAWWRYDAREARRVIRGTELLVPTREPTDWEWVWKDHFGCPAFLQALPVSVSTASSDRI